MATATEELNPPDLLSSVSIDQSMNSEHNQEPEDDRAEMPALNIKDCDLLNKINHLHCPFTWKPEDSLRSYNQDSVEEIMNVDEVFDEPSGFKLRKYVIHLILCYNNFGKRLLEKSLKHLDEMEKMLLTSMKNRSQDVYFTQINEALFHILHSCRVVMLHTTNQKEKAHQVLQKITPYNKLNATNQAGIWAVRANLYVEFGYEGIKASIQYIGRSTDIDASNSYWHFMRGMYLGRLRRMESAVQIPSMDEIASLELAMKLKEDASFMAFAAEVYVETANRSKKKSQQLLLIANENERRKLTEKNDLINERAAMLFKKSVSLNKNSAHLLFRCGKGLLKLTPPHQDVHLAHEYLKKGLELAYESSFGNHAMALYYMKHEEDYDMAKKYLTKATESKNFGADIDLIRVNFLVNQDPEALLDSLLVLFDRYDDKMKHQKILAEIESYYLFINYNLMEAIKYMNKLLYLIGDHDDIISVFKSGILRQKLPVSLLEILLSDITDRSSKNNLNAEEQEECRKFMHRLCFQNITLPQPKNENLRRKVLKEIRDNLKNIDANKAKRSLPSTSENPPRKDYNPVGKRFDKEYAKKYYAEDESSKHQKTVVDQFFEKYETALDSKSHAVEKPESSYRNRENPNASVEAKSKTESKIHPILQQLFDQVKKLPERVESFGDSSEQEDGETKEIIDRLARRLDLHFSLSAGAEITKKTSRSNNINIGASTSGHRDNFDSPEVYRRRSSRSPKRQSRSRDSHRAGKDSSYKRSDSRESYRSSKQSYRKRSPSPENRYSTRHRRSTSRDRSSRSTSRDHRRSRTRRSLSRESRLSSRNRKISSRRRSKSKDDRKSPRRRSISKETKYSTRSNRDRSASRESKKDLKPSRRRSISKETKYSTRSNRDRSTSRENGKDLKSPRRRSISKETKYSSKSNRNRSTSPDSRTDLKFSRRRSLSKESKYSTRSNRHRSTSRESKNDRKSSNKRSISRESKYSVRSSRRKSPSQERSAGKNERSSRRERSQSRESKKSPKQPIHKRSHSRESYKSSRDKRSASKEVRKRSKSKESIRSSKELANKRRSPSPESHKPSRRKERSISPESLCSSKSKNSRRERSPSEKRHDRHSQVDDYDSKTIPIDSNKSNPAKERSRSRESRYSSRRSPPPKQKEHSGRSKKYESDDTLTEFDNSDTDYKRDKSRKSHRKDRYEDDRRDYRRNDRRRSSSEETRPIRSGSKEKPRSSRISSRDRRDNNRRKYNDRKNKKRSSSEESSSDSSRSSRELGRVPRNSRHRESSCNEDSNSKNDFKDQKKLKNQEANERVTSSSRSVEKGDDKIQSSNSVPNSDA